MSVPSVPRAGGARCGCCGAVFALWETTEAITHAGMICGPRLETLEWVLTSEPGRPCPHDTVDWRGNPRMAS